MYTHLKDSLNLVDDVFRIINDMDDTSENLDEDLLQQILVHCALNTEQSRYNLLAFVNEKVSLNGIDGRDDLIVCLYEIYQEEYDPIHNDPIKLEIKKQLDSLALNPEPKDDLVNLILSSYLTQYNIHAFLITGNEHPTSTIYGSNFFAPVPTAESKTELFVNDIFAQIQKIIQSMPDTERMFFIIRQQAHYMVLDYQSSMRQCIIMDAAGDARQLNFLKLCYHVPEIENIIYVKNEEYIANKAKKNTSLQKDNMSCSIFSLDHVLSAGLSHNLHTELKRIKIDETSNIGYISWLQAPPQLVRNAQSPTFRSKYLESRPDASEYLTENCFEKTMKSIKRIGSESLLIAASDCAASSPSFGSGW